MITALAIFLLTYLFIGLRQIPALRIDRPAGALVGAVLMVTAGVLTLDEAFAAVDMRTLLLLLGMMIITAYLRAAGFFELVADRILSLSRTPFQLLVFIAVSSGLLSALFVNDTICLLYTPIVLEVTSQLGVPPVPYLLALAMSSNIGSAMTVTGNPQNMLIGTYAQIHYLTFLRVLWPVSLIGLVVNVGVISLIYRRDLGPGTFSARPRMPGYRVRTALLVKSLLVVAGVLAAFLAGRPYALVAAAGATVLLLTARVRTETILKDVDWPLLLFFAGLFVVMRGVETSGLAAAVIGRAGDLTRFSPAGRIAGLSVVAAALSNLVSNVPAVMLLKPLTESIGGGQTAWLALAMSSTLAGNLTLIGSVANLIVVQQARRKVSIGFREYFRAGAVVTAVTILAGILVLVVCDGVARGAEPVAPAAGTITVSSGSVSGASRSFAIVVICADKASQVKGLQGFRRLGAREAAIFVFDPPRPVSFWMASVRYPIDIVYVDAAGRVTEVRPDFQPGSREVFQSHGAVRWVIETAAGSGIAPGDRVRVE